MDIRETAKATASAFASDPKGTAKFIASAGAKSALQIPLKLGGRAIGPAIGVAVRAVGVLNGAANRGRQVRDLLPGGGNGQRPTPVAMPPSEATSQPRPAPPAPSPAKPAPTQTAATTSAAPVIRSVPTTVPEADSAVAGPPEAAIAAGAPGTAQETVARIEAALGETTPSGADLSRDELPIDDYDHLTLASLRARLARLELVDLLQLRDYEKAHANRLPVVTMLENRIAKVGGTSASASSLDDASGSAS